MGKPLKVLMVEDSEDDATLITRHVNKGGYDPDVTRVETAEDLKKALENREWDVVLSDYMLPDFNGLKALEILKESGLDIPFVLISGTVGEGLAVEAMKAGASDYLMKDKLARLAPAIERELAQADERRKRKRADDKIKGQLEELQRWQEVMLGREDRVQELKREVNELCHRIGGTARYLNQEDTSADSGTVEPTS